MPTRSTRSRERIAKKIIRHASPNRRFHQRSLESSWDTRTTLPPLSDYDAVTKTI